VNVALAPLALIAPRCDSTRAASSVAIAPSSLRSNATPVMVCAGASGSTPFQTTSMP
jgi:hypothetical protein